MTSAALRAQLHDSALVRIDHDRDLLNDAQPSRVARSIVHSPRGARNEDLSSDGLTSLIKIAIENYMCM